MAVASKMARKWKWKEQILTIYFGLSDPDAPFTAKIPAIFSLIYLLSPIDLIPDVIPFAGWLDDLVIVPLLLSLSIKLLPPPIRERARAQARRESSRINYFLIVVGVIFTLLIILLIYALKKLLTGS
jgi:uncharacterized membrane protein YkvA (DUF1232 family)